MPNIKSAIKRVDVINKKTLQNNMIKSAYKTAIKSFENSVEAEKKEDNYQEGDYQYVNKDYYYASETTVTPVTYTYNYEGGFTQKEEIPNACSRMCEESLIVEYGPPQAAIAGFCIEYQVKVTSRVKCTSKINVQPNETLNWKRDQNRRANTNSLFY